MVISKCHKNCVSHLDLKPTDDFYLNLKHTGRHNVSFDFVFTMW